MPEEGEFEEGEIARRVEKEIEKKMESMGGIKERRRLMESNNRQSSPDGNIYAKQKMILEKLNEIEEGLEELKSEIRNIQEDREEI